MATTIKHSSTKKEIDRANPKISAVDGQFIDELIGCIFGECPEAIVLLIHCAIVMTKSPLGARLLDQKLRCCLTHACTADGKYFAISYLSRARKVVRSPSLLVFPLCCRTIHFHGCRKARSTVSPRRISPLEDHVDVIKRHRGV